MLVTNGQTDIPTDRTDTELGLVEMTAYVCTLLHSDRPKMTYKIFVASQNASW